MALQISYSSPYGSVLPNAYVRINALAIHYDGSPRLEVSIAIHMNKTARDSGKTEIRAFGLTTPPLALQPGDTDMRDPVYRWLKSRIPDGPEPDLRQATDV